MECEICPRPSKFNSALCRFHYFALKRLVGRFELWQTAVEVDWPDYLQKVKANPLTGVWVREVIAWSDASHKSKEELKEILGKATLVPQDP